MITNTGSADLKVSNIVLSGANTGDFALSALPTFPAVIAPSATATFGIAFTPTTTGARSASVLVQNDDAANPTASIALTGSGISPLLVIDPPAAAFGNVQVTTQANQVITLSNTGTDSLTISALQITGAATFTLTTPPAFPLVIAAGANSSLTVTYAPTAIAADTGTLTLVNDMPGATPNFTVPLSGQGISGVLGAAPLAIDFGSVTVGSTSATKDVTLSNTGNAPLAITAVSITGADAVLFPLTDVPALPATIAVGESAVVKIAFKPAAHGAVSGKLHLVTATPARLRSRSRRPRSPEPRPTRSRSASRRPRRRLLRARRQP